MAQQRKIQRTADLGLKEDIPVVLREESPFEPVKASSNPLLQRIVIPGETFRLPSGGFLYDGDGVLSPDVKHGEVTVNPMNVMDEIQLKSPDRLFSGASIEEVFRHCIPQVQKPLELFTKDMDFLLVCIRKVSYGEEIEVRAKHICKDALEHMYRISLTTFIKSVKTMDPAASASRNNVSLPNGQTVTLNPPRFKHMIRLYHLLGVKTVDDEDGEAIKDQLLQTAMSVIHDVDGIVEENLILEWLEQIPVGWLGMISGKIEEISDWGPDFTITVECRDCKEQFKLTTQLNPVSLFF